MLTMFRPIVRHILALAAVLAIAPACAESAEESALLRAEAAWVRTPPPGARMLGGYLQLHNPGDEAVHLVGGRSPAFGMVEIHQSFEQDGRMRMREVNPLTIDAGESVTLAPGGLHLMLMRPTGTLSDGEQVEITLVDKRGRELAIAFTVRRDAP